MMAIVLMSQAMKIIRHNRNIIDIKYKQLKHNYDRVQRIACLSLYNSNQERNFNPMSSRTIVIRFRQMTEDLI